MIDLSFVLSESEIAGTSTDRGIEQDRLSIRRCTPMLIRDVGRPLLTGVVVAVHAWGKNQNEGDSKKLISRGRIGNCENGRLISTI